MNKILEMDKEINLFQLKNLWIEVPLQVMVFVEFAPCTGRVQPASFSM